ncbi:MAG: RICIN domain-containing protein [Flavobacteriales bacterium]
MRLILLMITMVFFLACGKEDEFNEDEYFIPEPEPVEETLPDPEGTQYATWINIWNRSSETHWWNPNHYYGATVYVNGKWQSIDWTDNAQIDEYIENLKEAGITILICDYTNGWGWLDDKVQYIQTLCAENGMKLCLAENSKGDVSVFESRALDVWQKFAKSSLTNGSTYLRKDGKPVIVCYSTRDWYNSYVSSTKTFTNKFSLVWASGEGAKIDKWGWQLEPSVGSIPSTDAMFVTSAIKWGNWTTTGVESPNWRKSLSYLDYNFLLVKQNNPKYIIVGSYDDIRERNGWLVANTTNSIPSMQMRDKNGAISTDAYFNRVKEWIKGSPTSTPGGYIQDGCYRVINRSTKKVFNLEGNEGKLNGLLIQNAKSNEGLNDYYWFYHLGNNSYRIIGLNSALSLDILSTSDNSVYHNFDDDVPSQKWTLEDAGEGHFFIMNNMTGKVLEVEGASMDSGSSIIQSTKNNGTNQQWEIEKVLSF